MAAGFSIAELHLEDREEGPGSDSSSEFANSDDWETGPVASSGEESEAAMATAATLGAAAAQQQASSTRSGSARTSDEAAVGGQQQRRQQLAASESSDSEGSNVATVMVRASHDEGSRAPTTAAATHAAGSSPKHAAGAIPASRSKQRLVDADVPAINSVSAATLQLASSKTAAPDSLSLTKLAAEANRNLTGAEKKEKGGISVIVLRSYIGAAGGVLVAAAIVLVMAAEQGSRVMTDTFLGWWAADLFDQVLWFYIGIYLGLGVLYSLLTFVR